MVQCFAGLSCPNGDKTAISHNNADDAIKSFYWNLSVLCCYEGKFYIMCVGYFKE